MEGLEGVRGCVTKLQTADDCVRRQTAEQAMRQRVRAEGIGDQREGGRV
jgi:hypothetical protein